jgi:hypothetical protein
MEWIRDEPVYCRNRTQAAGANEEAQHDGCLQVSRRELRVPELSPSSEHDIILCKSCIALAHMAAHDDVALSGGRNGLVSARTCVEYRITLR